MMQQTKKLPIEDIRGMSLEEIAEKLRALDEMPKEIKEMVSKEAYGILNTKKYCDKLGVDWTNRRRADYAAMLIVTEGYTF